MRFFLLILVFIFTSSFPVLAEPLSRGDVEDHLQATSDVYNIKPISMDKIYKFTESYMVDSGVYISNIFINDAEKPVTISKNRDQALKTLKDMKERYVNASARFEIATYTQDPQDLSKATVKYKLWHEAKIERDLDETRVGRVSFTSIADCTDVFQKKDGVIKSPSSICDIHMTQAQPEFLNKADLEKEKAQ